MTDVGPMFLASVLAETFEEYGDEALAAEAGRLLHEALTRHGYELAPVSNGGVYVEAIVPCRDTREELDGAVCTGEFRYGPHDIQAKCTVCGGWRGRWAPSDLTVYQSGVAYGRRQAAADLVALADRLDDECAAHGVAAAHSNGMRNAADVLTGDSWLVKRDGAAA